MVRKNYFMGLAAGIQHPWRHLLTRGSRQDAALLCKYLNGRYGGETMLCKNGRSALTLALKAYFNPGDAVIVTGFTCHAVYEAVKAAGLKPVFADISRDNLNFDVRTLERLWADSTGRRDVAQSSSDPRSLISGIIVQNTLGNPVEMKGIEQFAGKHGLVIIEDLAHCAGGRYPDGREVGTVGAAAVLSFGKEKAIDTVSGGAVVFRFPRWHNIETPSKRPRVSDYLREKWYPVLGLWCRRLTRIHLGGALMRGLIKLHFVQKSADNRLDVEQRPAYFEAKLALAQLRQLRPSSQRRLREFYLVNNRDAVLKELRAAGYYFDGLWYEKPVSPERYYKKIHFNEKDCPVSTEISRQIINLPNYYSKNELAWAHEIIKKHLVEDKY